MTLSAALLFTERAEVEGWGDQVEEWNAMPGRQTTAQCFSLGLLPRDSQYSRASVEDKGLMVEVVSQACSYADSRVGTSRWGGEKEGEPPVNNPSV